MGILHVRILWIFPIKNVAYIAFRKFHLHGVFWSQSSQFCCMAGKKNTGNYLSEMTLNWGRLRTVATDLHSAMLGFCLKKSIFVLKNCSEWCGDISTLFYSHCQPTWVGFTIHNRVLSWALTFILRLRFSPGSSPTGDSAKLLIHSRLKRNVMTTSHTS